MNARATTVLAVVLVACAPASPPAPPVTPPQRPLEAPAVRLLVAGAEPQAIACYRLTPGRAETLAYERRDASKQFKAGDDISDRVALPDVSLRASVRIEDSEPPRLTVEIDHGGSATAAIDGCGNAGAFVWSVPAGAGPQLGRRVQHAALTLARLRPVFPAAAIGPGARWKVTYPIDDNGIHSTEEMTYELERRVGDTLTIAVTQSVRSDTQRVDESDVIVAPFDLIGGGAAGEGRIVTELDAIVPVRATLETRIGLEMQVTRDGERREVLAKVQMHASIERR